MTGVSTDAASAASKRLGIAYSNASEGENNLRDSLVDARKAGVAGTGLADFMKDRGFKEAVTLLNGAANDLDKEVKALQGIADKAASANTALAALKANIEKDLAKRKDNSESKKDIENLLAKIGTDRKTCTDTTKSVGQKIAPRDKNYGAELPKTITKLVQGAPEEQAEAKHKNEAPQKLQDRVLNTHLQKVMAAHKQVVAACDAAVDKSGDGDKGGAQAELKKAAVARQKALAISAEYKKLVAEFKDHVDNSKDKGKSLAAVAKMADRDTTPRPARAGAPPRCAPARAGCSRLRGTTRCARRHDGRPGLSGAA